MASQNQQQRGIMGMFGGHKKADQVPVTGTGHHAAAGTTSGSEYDSGVKERQSKKGGIMDKIKNVLPGSHNKQQDEYATTTPTATTGTGTGTGTGEKVGMMDKIKNILPGTHNK